MEINNISLNNKIDIQDKLNEEGNNDFMKLVEENEKLKMKINSLKETLEMRKMEIKDLEENKSLLIKKNQQEIENINRNFELKCKDFISLKNKYDNLDRTYQETRSFLSKTEDNLKEEREKNFRI